MISTTALPSATSVADEAVKPFRFGRRQHRSWFVENDQACIQIEHLGKLDDAVVRRPRDRCTRPDWIEVRREPLRSQCRLRPLPARSLGFASQGAFGNAASRFSRTDSGGTSENCWNTMPMPPAMASRGDAKLTGLPSMQISPASGVIEAVEHFHQSAFAGAVFAQQRQHLAGANFKINIDRSRSRRRIAYGRRTW